jgi:hypothetical protein
MHGVVTIAAIQGGLCGGVFWLLGIPAAALWGLLTVFASVVPLVGTAAVWVPGTVVSARDRRMAEGDRAGRVGSSNRKQRQYIRLRRLRYGPR